MKSYNECSLRVLDQQEKQQQSAGDFCSNAFL